MGRKPERHTRTAHKRPVDPPCLCLRAPRAVSYWVANPITTIPTSTDGEIGTHEGQECKASTELLAELLEAGEARATPAALADEGDDITIDFSKKRKTKKVSKLITSHQEMGAGPGIGTALTTEDVSSGDDAGATEPPSDPYSYGVLLSRLFEKLQQEHPSHPTLRSFESGRARKSNVPPPTLARVGGRRVAVCNFGLICAALRRPTAHVQSFVESELATTTSLDAQAETLTLLGRYTDKHVEQLLRKYIHEFVVCAQCKALETDLHKCGREWIIRCVCCNAEETRAAIKSGFRALRKGERRVAREVGASS